MADATYPVSGTGVYRAQGGNEVVVGTTGRITGNTSDNWTLNESNLTLGTSGNVLLPVSTASTASDITNNGVSSVSATTAAGNNTYTIAAPVAGTIKWINCTGANSSDAVIISASTAVTFLAGASQNKLKIIAKGLLPLAGISSTVYSTITVSTAVAFPTS